jgi:hypothetical protein
MGKDGPAADGMGVAEYAEASAMERHFLDGRIRLLYYLYAFFIAGLTLGAAAFGAAFQSEWGSASWLVMLVTAAFVFGLLSVLSFLSYVTIRNWNLALGHYGAQKLAVLTEVYGQETAAARLAVGLPDRIPLLSSPPGESVELPALLLALLGLAVSLAAAGLIGRLAPALALLTLIAPSLAPFTALVMLCSPARLKAWLLQIDSLKRWWRRSKTHRATYKRLFSAAYVAACLVTFALTLLLLAAIVPRIVALIGK